MKTAITLALPLLALFAPLQAQAQFRPVPPDRYYARPPVQVEPWDRDRVRSRVPDLSGTWYMGGDPNKPCEVRQRWPERRALFINEFGDSAWGTIDGDRIWVPDWVGYNNRPGLEGAFRGDKIVWFNGSFWAR
jgi:hypothetical protein